MIASDICAGGCGLKTTILAESSDSQNVRLEFRSECPDIIALSGSLKEVDAYTACFGPMKDSPVYLLASKHCSHTGCPVPMGIIRTLEAACGLALPHEVSIQIRKE